MFRRFVLSLARLAFLLIKKLREDKPISFGNLNYLEATDFQCLNYKLSKLQVMSLIKLKVKLIFDTETCNRNVG